MSRGSALLDGAVVTAAVLLVLSVLDDSFSPRTHLPVGVVPVLLLVALAWALRGRDGGGWAFVVVAILAYAPVGALVALQDPGPFIVPRADTMGRVLAATVTGPLELVGTLPPVDASGTVLVVPYAVGFVSGGGAAWLALGTRRPVMPVLPVLLGLALTIPLGVLVPAGLVVRGAALGGLLLWWVVVRSRRTQRAVGSARGAVPQAVLSAVLVAVVSLLVVGLVPDRVETDRRLLRGTLQTEVAEQELSDPLGPGRQPGGRGRDGPQVLLRTEGVPAGERLRFAALDRYDGQDWVPATETEEGSGTFQRVGSEVTPVHAGTPVRVRVRVRPAYVSDWLPTLGELTGLDLEYTDGRTQLSQVRYNQDTSTAFVIGGVDPRDDYTFTAVLTPSRLERASEPARASAAQRQPAGRFLDPFLRRWSRRDVEPMERLRSFMTHLARTGRTRIGGGDDDLAPRSLGRGLLGAERMVGTPHQYAAVVALAASRLGVPGRVVVGADPDRRGRVLADDVSSWVEVRVRDGTWRRIDPRRYLGGQRLVGGGSAAAPTPAPPGGRGTGSGTDGRPQVRRLPSGTEVRLPPGTELPEQRDPREVAGLVLAGLAVLVVLALLLVAAAKLVRRRLRRSRRSWSARYVGAWQEVVDTARDRGTPVPEHLGRVPQARLLGAGRDLARRADIAVFAPQAPATGEPEDYWREADRLRRELLAAVPLRRRLLAAVSPASLLAGWQRHRSRGRAPQVGADDRGARGEPAAQR